METTPPLLSAAFLARLQQLELVARRMQGGRMAGQRRSPRKGHSIDFADHRGYVVGDDLRFVDWNLAARLDRLFIKLFEEEEDLHLYVLLDVSGSMGFGTPSKLRLATQLAAALAFLGLLSHDRVTIAPFASDALVEAPPLRGRQALWPLLAFLEGLQAQGTTAFARAARSFTARHSRPGLAVVIGDLLDKAGVEEGLRYLVARRMEITVVQILAAEEIDPPLKGDVELVDVEDGQTAALTISAPLLQRYRQRLDYHRHNLRDYCTQRGIATLFVDNQLAVEPLVMTYLRQRGLVR